MLLYMVAAVVGQPVTAENPPASPPHNYLHPPALGCDRAEDEIVVCADKDADSRYRVKPIDDQKYAETPIRAETKFAGGLLGVTAAPASVGGFASNRVMLTFKIKF
jgi:hypothetical protein